MENEERVTKKRKIDDIGPMPPKLVVEAMKGLNGIDDPELIIPKKTLCKSDVAPKKARFLLPRKIMDVFLTEDEKRSMRAQQKPSTCLRVALVDPELRNHAVSLCNWSKGYATFGKGWKQVIKENKFKVANVFSLWGFRSEGVEPRAHNVPDGGNLSGGHTTRTDPFVNGLAQGSLCFVLAPASDSGLDDHNDNLPEDSLFDKSDDDFNHLDFDSDESQGHLIGVNEGLSYNADGSIRYPGNEH